MRAGSLRHKVNVQQKETTATAPSGGAVIVWENLYEDVPASITPLTGKELELARQHVGRATHKIVMRYHPNIDATMRLAFGSRIFNIGFVQDMEERHFVLALLTTEELP